MEIRITSTLRYFARLTDCQNFTSKNLYYLVKFLAMRLWQVWIILWNEASTWIAAVSRAVLMVATHDCLITRTCRAANVGMKSSEGATNRSGVEQFLVGRKIEFSINIVNSHWYIWSFERKTYTWSSRKSSHSWNPADFVKSTHNLIKSDVSTKTIQFDECRRGAMTLDFTGEIRWISRVKSGWNPGEIRRISKDQLPGMVSPMFLWVKEFLILKLHSSDLNK